MQLNAQWLGTDGVRIGRDGVRLVDVPVKSVTKGKDWIKPFGNEKTEAMVGIISCLAGGCFRAATGFGRCSSACYCKEDGSGGCYSNATLHAEFRKNPKYNLNPYNVIYNGYMPGTESWFKVKVPKSFDLSMYPRKVWRVDSETSTSCLSLALGLTQRFAEANPSKIMTGISSDYFFVPNDMLDWAARCGNIVTGHTLSSWFSPDDLMNRVEQALRFQSHGVPTTLWVVTNPEWDEANPESKRIVDGAIDMFQSSQIIVLGYHDHGTHLVAAETPNSRGCCCELRVNKEGRRVDTDTMTVDGEPLKGIPYGKCGVKGMGGCKLFCGATWLMETRRAAA